jgi:mannose-6-phosphate isomerase-like protein (cupin superfamily)
MVTSPDFCIVRLRAGERMSKELAALLDPVDMASMHEYLLPARTPVELHYHDFDEYWLFTEGKPAVTLRLPDGTMRVYHLEPGDMVATLRGVEHTLFADHALRYFQFSSVRRPDARSGHLTRA